jgi:predicted adenine nucleotide alpha hydrolase (AANH) superfamily ATPase
LRLLLHCCCGPCSLEVADHFRSLGYEVTAWFFNPNIHPPAELARREAAMRQAAGAEPHPAFSESGSACVVSPSPRAERGKGVRFPARRLTLLDFLLLIARNEGARCRACYRLRLEETARAAGALGYDAFSTTLTISPYQDVGAIQEVGERAARAAGVRFLYADLREHYHGSAQRARELGLYRQNYCGCLFSALERAERRARRAIARD